MPTDHIAVTQAHIRAARILVDLAPELGETVSPLIARIAAMPLPDDPTAPPAVDTAPSGV